MRLQFITTSDKTPAGGPQKMVPEGSLVRSYVATTSKTSIPTSAIASVPCSWSFVSSPLLHAPASPRFGIRLEVAWGVTVASSGTPFGTLRPTLVIKDKAGTEVQRVSPTVSEYDPRRALGATAQFVDSYIFPPPAAGWKLYPGHTIQFEHALEINVASGTPSTTCTIALNHDYQPQEGGTMGALSFVEWDD